MGYVKKAFSPGLLSSDNGPYPLQEISALPSSLTSTTFWIKGTRLLVKGQVETDLLHDAWQDLQVDLAFRDLPDLNCGLSGSRIFFHRAAGSCNCPCCPPAIDHAPHSVTLQALEAAGAILGWEGMGQSSISNFFILPPLVVRLEPLDEICRGAG